MPAILLAAIALLVPSPAHGATLSARDRRAIDTLLDGFIPTALPRHHLARAYDLVTPRLRQGMTRARWAKSDPPVYPYPAKSLRYHSWNPIYVARNAVELTVLVPPRRAAEKTTGPIEFALDLKRIGGRWFVDDVSIAAIFPAVGSGHKVWSGKDTAPAAADSRPAGDDKSPISRAWIALPAGIVALIVLFPALFFLNRWRQDRRAIREYEANATGARAAGP